MSLLRFALTALALASIVGCRGAEPIPVSAKALAEQCRGAILGIRGQGRGSAVLLSDGRILTAAHVLGNPEPAEGLTVFQESTGIQSARCALWSPQDDFATLSTQTPLRGGLTLASDSSAPSWLMSRTANGALRVRPVQLALRDLTLPPLLHGLSAGGQPCSFRQAFLLQGRAEPGDSGGALLNDQGEVVALVSSGWLNDDLIIALRPKATALQGEATRDEQLRQLLESLSWLSLEQRGEILRRACAEPEPAESLRMAWRLALSSRRAQGGS